MGNEFANATGLERAQAVLGNLSDTCLACKNLGTTVCPEFSKAVADDNGASEFDLMEVIAQQQAGRVLKACANG